MEENLYNATLNIPIFNQRNEECERRNITVTIVEFRDNLQIKLRDLSEYSFNYTENIDLGDFEVIRVKQCLDINFSEFKDNLVEMLNQFGKKEMLFKCQMGDKKCTMIFYQISKIKSIIYLTLELHLTDQKEIISEMINEIQDMQQSNRRLQKQLAKSKKVVQEKELEAKELQCEKEQMMAAFLENMRKVQIFFEQKQSNVQTVLTLAVDNVKGKLDTLKTKVDFLKQNNIMKISSGNRLAKNMEKLKLDNMDQAAKMQELKKQNCSLNAARLSLEKNLADLKKSMDDAQIINHNLERRKEELEKDLEKISIALTQKDKHIEEMSKDLVQANTMLVNFNNHYDNKAKEAEELKNDRVVKETQIREQKVQFNQLLKDYQDYERRYNKDNFEKLKQNLLVISQRNDELEDQVRKLNKMNALLSQKVSQGGFFNLH